MSLFDTDLWLEIIESLSRHKLRTTLTAFGVFWGIFMLVNLLGAGAGLRNGANATLGNSNNMIALWSGRPTSIPYKGLTKGRYIHLKDADIKAIYENVPGVDVVAPRNGIGTQFVTHGSKTDSFDINGIHPAQQSIRGYGLIEGRLLNQLDQDNKRKNILIGSRVKETLFEPDEDAIGQFIEIKGIQFLVVGIMKPLALNNWSQREDSKIFLAHSTMRRSFNQKQQVHSMYILPLPGVNAFDVERDVLKTVRKRNKVHPDDHGVIGSYNSQKDFDEIRSLFGGIAVFSWVVAIGTIIAGAVGVGNIMLISVKERTREIGIRKALGATPANIVSSIIQESLIITFFAGYLGLAAGVGTIELLGKYATNADGGFGTFINPEVSFSTAFCAIAVLLIAGALASLLPARNAARVDPVIALQSE